MNRIWNTVATLSFGIILMTGCNKFLEEKSDKSLAIPTTADDFKALLNDWGYVNSDFASMGEACSDDFYLTDEDYSSLYYESDKRLYSWMPDYVTRSLSGGGHEWWHCYKGIYVSNSILKGLDENNLRDRRANEIRGQALVFRAARYLDGIQIWAPVYNRETAASDLGMVIRLDPDMNLPSVRATVQETYDQILKDLAEALPILPVSTISPALPTQAAAHGLLARAYLIMGDYDRALQNAEQSLSFQSNLIDFNDLDEQASFPIPVTNQISSEVVFFTRMYGSNMVNNLDIAKINPDLYGMYQDGDRRKAVYFRADNEGHYLFKGTHMGHSGLITGITTAELLLISAECYARLDDVDKAALTLNRLMINRLNKQSYQPYQFQDKHIALNTVLAERRKELIFRGLRWSDIKRLNRDGASITLHRTINGQNLNLMPNDKRYAIALPEDVIEISGIQQNSR
ncbi:RagB/SusD family nutrient uptake outer membrane protein [Sphingobacterium gobiense]|uniref:Uncharacterized protein n=1 Tax=Sphingobacterium gobiense TaxID=1382456 RepID=A0A2S9JTU0_9SPHI|nr:RagB/SusD family nutrient uptake outer membrane protein [Sphingobacterium gobiense]PRD56705.1 hypothetical protein C5749_05595 [Sphingobacterium gobiense]